MINREKEKGLWGAKVCHQAHIDSLVCEMTSEYYDFFFLIYLFLNDVVIYSWRFKYETSGIRNIEKGQ